MGGYSMKAFVRLIPVLAIFLLCGQGYAFSPAVLGSSSGSIYDISTMAAKATILAGGGSVIDLSFLDRVIKHAKANRYWTLIKVLSSPQLSVTKDGSGYVSSLWEIKNGNNTGQSTGAYQPQWLADQQNGKAGLVFANAQATYLTGTFTNTPPYLTYIVFKATTFTQYRYILDGWENDSFAFYQDTPSPKYTLYASSGGEISGLAFLLNATAIASFYVSSSAGPAWSRHNADAKVTGATQKTFYADAHGMTLAHGGNRPSPTYNGTFNGSIYFIMQLSAPVSDDVDAAIMTLLNTAYGVYE